MSEQQERNLGFLRTCIDKRFVDVTRKAFEVASHLGPTDYWHEAYAGGSALPAPSDDGLHYATKNKWSPEHPSSDAASILGWQAHLNSCGGQPGVSDQEITRRLDDTLIAMLKSYPNSRHFRLLASLDKDKQPSVDVREYSTLRSVDGSIPVHITFNPLALDRIFWLDYDGNDNEATGNGKTFITHAFRIYNDKKRVEQQSETFVVVKEGIFNVGGITIEISPWKN